MTALQSFFVILFIGSTLSLAFRQQRGKEKKKRRKQTRRKRKKGEIEISRISLQVFTNPLVLHRLALTVCNIKKLQSGDSRHSPSALRLLFNFQASVSTSTLGVEGCTKEIRRQLIQRPAGAQGQAGSSAALLHSPSGGLAAPEATRGTLFVPEMN